MNDRIIHVEVTDGKIYVSEDNTSGAVYDGSSAADVGYAVECYLQDY